MILGRRTKFIMFYVTLYITYVTSSTSYPRDTLKKVIDISRENEMYINTRGIEMNWTNGECKTWAKEMHQEYQDYESRSSFMVPFRIENTTYDVRIECFDKSYQVELWEDENGLGTVQIDQHICQVSEISMDQKTIEGGDYVKWSIHERSMTLHNLYPFESSPRIPGGYYISLIQCLFTNDDYYTTLENAVLQLADFSDIKFSSFLKTGETFYQKYQFKYTHKPVLFQEHILDLIRIFQNDWISIRDVFCETIETTKESRFSLYDNNCRNYKMFNDFIKKIENIDYDSDRTNKFKKTQGTITKNYYHKIIVSMIQTIKNLMTKFKPEIKMNEDILNDLVLQIDHTVKTGSDDHDMIYQKDKME